MNLDEVTVNEEFDYVLRELNIHVFDLYDLDREFYKKFDKRGGTLTEAIKKLRELKPFAAGGNIFESGQEIDDRTLFVMRWLAGTKMKEALQILKFDLEDPNLKQDLNSGNIGTAQRWAKTVTGASIEDDSEMMCGRYTKKPRLAVFPNNEQKQGIPITKRVDVASVCSHHFLPYGTLLREDSYAIISYIPGDFVLGISKLQRLADWVCRRPTIQEDLVKTLWQAISEAAKTEDVYVGLFNARHTCESLRGSQSHDGAFSTEYYSGRFDDPEVRKQIKY